VNKDARRKNGEGVFLLYWNHLLNERIRLDVVFGGNAAW
jgi:hypothetical protein